eukprot:Lankesteria_metandrocarpae@DN11035_c0_g1_i1.p1
MTNAMSTTVEICTGSTGVLWRLTVLRDDGSFHCPKVESTGNTRSSGEGDLGNYRVCEGDRVQLVVPCGAVFNQRNMQLVVTDAVGVEQRIPSTTIAEVHDANSFTGGMCS